MPARQAQQEKENRRCTVGTARRTVRLCQRSRRFLKKRPTVGIFQGAAHDGATVCPEDEKGMMEAACPQAV
jgi:hypothetical protein